MKNKYLKSILITLLIGISSITTVFSQSTVADNNWVASRFLGFNNTNGINPLFFKTNDINRMRLNGTLNYNISGYAGTRNGYLLLGDDALFPVQGAFSQLHLTGVNGTGIQQFGFRPCTV
jgi:hypothetical protein